MESLLSCRQQNCIIASKQLKTYFLSGGVPLLQTELTSRINNFPRSMQIMKSSINLHKRRMKLQSY